MNRKNQHKTQRTITKHLSILFTLFFFLLGAGSCSNGERQEGDEETAEEINTRLESTEWEAREGQSEWDDKNIETVTNTPEEQFTELDRDTDQRLTYEEFMAEVEYSDFLRGWDTNNDNRVTELELTDGLFTNWDRDEDNFIDGSEYQAFNSVWRDRHGDNFTTWDTDDDDRLNREEFRTGLSETGAIREWDTDKDNEYSEEELRRATFESRDVDRDTYLTEEEYTDMEYNIWGLNDL